MQDDLYDPANVAALFDRCSPAYRWWSAVASFGMIALWRRACVGRLVGQQGIARVIGGDHKGPPQVVDLMAGTGEAWPHVLRALPNARITAIDISERMHAKAVARLHGPRAHRIRHIAANVLDHPLEPGSADLIISTFGLKTFNADQQRRLAGQIARTLRPGGAFALIEAADPQGWALRPLYRFYLDRVLPWVERLALNGAQDFAMIGTYTRGFGDCTGFAAALRDEGLAVSQQRHFFGCASSVAGIKPVAPASAPA